MRHSMIFTGVWFLLSLVQAGFVNLTSDEGYYWFYSTHLQWGYYDHPPAIALMIKAGSLIFNDELGVRLLNVIFMSGSFLLFFLLLPSRLRNRKIAFILLLSQPLLHYFSIIVFPDGPLIFFSLLFLLGYRRWIQHDDILSAGLMGLSLAGMLYSKYHGLLVLLFTVLSNFRLLKSKWFWTAIGMASLLALPHLWWQAKNGLPSLGYHFQKRIVSLDFRFVGQYISQQFLAFGPVFLFAAIAIRNRDVFERTLRIIVLGTLVFFLLVSFKSFVHFHWTSVAIFPAVYLAIIVFESKQKQRLVYWLTIPFIMIILLFRMHIVQPFIPLSARDIGYYQDRDSWAREISDLAGDRPVVFVGNFREAGLYGFYTGKPSLAVFNYQERKSQYDLWDYEDGVQGKSVMIVEKIKSPRSYEAMSVMKKRIFYRYLPRFQSLYDIPVEITRAEIKKDSLFLSIEIANARPDDLVFRSDSINGPPELFYMITNKKNAIRYTGVLKMLDSADRIRRAGKRKYFFKTYFGLSQNDYWLEAGFRHSGLPAAVNTRSRFLIKKINY